MGGLRGHVEALARRFRRRLGFQLSYLSCLPSQVLFCALDFFAKLHQMGGPCLAKVLGPMDYAQRWEALLHIAKGVPEGPRAAAGAAWRRQLGRPGRDSSRRSTVERSVQTWGSKFRDRMHLLEGQPDAWICCRSSPRNS